MCSLNFSDVMWKQRGLYQNKATPASLPVRGQVTLPTTVKWTRFRPAIALYNNLYVKTNMSFTYWLVIAALDLTAVVFSARMLRRCFLDKMNNTFLYKCKTLVICQCVCQATFLVTDAVQLWKGFEIQARESCDIFRVMSISTLFFQACNITAMALVCSDHGSSSNQDASVKRKITAVLSLGLIGSAMIWWYNCFSQEFLSQMTLVVLSFVVAAAFVLLFAADIRDRLVNTSEETPMKIKTRSLAWNVCKGNKRPLAFIVLLLTCLVVVLSDVPRSTFHFNVTVFSAIVIFQRFSIGIGLPLTLTDSIDSSSEQDHDQEKFVVI